MLHAIFSDHYSFSWNMTRIIWRITKCIDSSLYRQRLLICVRECSAKHVAWVRIGDTFIYTYTHINPYHYAPMCTKIWSVVFWFVSIFFLVRSFSLCLSVPLSLKKAYLCVIHTCAWTFYVFAFGVTRSYNGFSGDCWKFLSALKFICKKSHRSWMIHSFEMMKTIFISPKVIKTSSECNIFQLLYQFRPFKNLVS